MRSAKILLWLDVMEVKPSLRFGQTIVIYDVSIERYHKLSFLTAAHLCRPVTYES